MILKAGRFANTLSVLRVLRALRGEKFSRRFGNLQSGAGKFAQAARTFTRLVIFVVNEIMVIVAMCHVIHMKA